jgi:hypothetical protein
LSLRGILGMLSALDKGKPSERAGRKATDLRGRFLG